MLPDGKITNFRDILYYGTNKVRLASYNDIIGTSISLGLLKMLSGSFQLNRKYYIKNTINLGSTPECLLIGYNMSTRMYGRTRSVDAYEVPMVVIRNINNPQAAAYGNLIVNIVQNGFSYDYANAQDFSDTITIDYVSFYIS